MRILWVKTSPLHPLTRGGDLRTFQLLRELHQRHEITFAGMTADAGQFEGAKQSHIYSTRSLWTHEPKCSLEAGRLRFAAGAAANLFSNAPYAVQRFTSKRWRDQISLLLEEYPFDLVLCDFLFPAASLPWSKKRPRQPWVLFQHNVECMIWKRRAAERRGIPGMYFTNQWQRMEKYERDTCQQFDAVLTVSEEDTQTSRDLHGLENLAGHVPTGVDVEFFSVPPRQTASVPTVVFMGSMDWHANVDAVLHFATEIWPLVVSRLPEARFVVVGRDPPLEIRNLATTTKNIEVTGTVKDVRPFLRSAHAMVVPLRIGGGTRLKIFEAMAAEVPVVSTSVGAEGLPLENGRHFLRADTPSEFGEAVIAILNSQEIGIQLAKNARTEIAEQNSWRQAAAVMENYLQKLVSPIL